MFIEILLEVLCLIVLGAVVRKSRKQIPGGVGVGVDRFFRIYIVLALVVVYRIEQV